MSGRLPRRLAAGFAGLVLGAGGFGAGPAASHAARGPLRAPAGQECAPPASDVAHAVPWPQQRLAPQRAWVLSRGEGVVVAVLDTGVSTAAPALKGAVITGKDLTAPSTDKSDGDCLGHGTFVAGLVAARPVPDVGFVGLAPAARVLAIRVANTRDQLTEGVDPDVLAKGVRHAVDRDAGVILVGTASAVPSPALAEAVAYAASRDVVIVAPAAVPGDGRKTPLPYPAGYDEVIAVGAGLAPANDAPSENDASASPATAPPELVAPAQKVVSIGTSGPGHTVGEGPEFAAAFVAASAALVRGYDQKLSAPEVRERLRLTADSSAAKLPDPITGFGVVDPINAVAAALPSMRRVEPRTSAAGAAVQASAPVDNRSTTIAFAVAGGVLALTAVGGLIAFTVLAGRRRGWRRG